jgi:cobyrinic acid a,c-diamide synthase
LKGFFYGGCVIKGLIIAGTMSGCGKTTVTLGVMACLAKRGLHVAPFKVGPDFIDPGHHTRITGTASRNLDRWMLSKSYNVKNFLKHTRSADIAVVEGVMGLFDGYDGKSEMDYIWAAGIPSFLQSSFLKIQVCKNRDRMLSFCHIHVHPIKVIGISGNNLYQRYGHRKKGSESQRA